MILADITTGELISNGVAIGLFLVALVALFRKSDVKVDQPITVKVIEALHDKFASKVEFERQTEENKREHENLFSKIGGVDRGFAQKVTNEVTAIHARINLLDKSNSRLEATTERQNVQLADLGKKMDAIPEMERRLDGNSEKRISDVHDRVNEILEAVGEMRGELKNK